MERRRAEEASLIEQVARYAEEYRARHAAELEQERSSRHANGEVLVEGCWIPQADADRVVRRLERHEWVSFIEISLLLFVLAILGRGVWVLFAFLFLP
jgi:hypothetical protein